MIKFFGFLFFKDQKQLIGVDMNVCLEKKYSIQKDKEKY
jgi:hypothetical protein